MDQHFRWTDRLHNRRDFSTVFKQGQRYVSSGLVLWVYRHPEPPSSGPRLGLAIPKAYGNAVQRNRLKRLLRETFRLNKNTLPRGVDLVFSGRTLFPKARYQTIEPVVKGLWKKANLL